MTRQEKALIARALNDQGKHGLRASSETLHLFSEAAIEEARRVAMAKIDRRKPRRKHART